jgi:TRAP-type C4-dicarboxylate transport system permease large subunit
VLTIEQVPQMLTGAMLGIRRNKIVLLLIINALFF